MNLPYMIELQGGLMKHIMLEHELDEIPLRSTILAFLVEVGELANETRFFKYWSKNRKQSEKTLEEYVDGLHLILQTGILIDFKFPERAPLLYWTSLESQFEAIYKTTTRMFDYIHESEYKRALGLYISLGEMLGFTPEQIEEAYVTKNKMNHERQNTGY